MSGAVGRREDSLGRVVDDQVDESRAGAEEVDALARRAGVVLPVAFVDRVGSEFVISKPQNQASDPLTSSVTELVPSFPSRIARSPSACRTTMGFLAEPVSLLVKWPT